MRLVSALPASSPPVARPWFESRADSELAFMIAEVFSFLKDRLNRDLPRDAAVGPAEDLFVYVRASKEDSMSFKPDSVSLLLVKTEEETTLRSPDLYRRTTPEGRTERIDPDIRMNLYVLFVARFADDYAQSLRHLSRIIRYFQKDRVFNRDNAPELSPAVSQLVMQLITPSFSEQNELWGSLRTAYQPSAMYKVTMIVFADEAGAPIAEVKQLAHAIVRKAG
jgi:hypothetical protein